MKKETKMMREALKKLIDAAKDLCEEKTCNDCKDLTDCIKNIRLAISTLATVLDQLFLRIDNFITAVETQKPKELKVDENYFL